jgi:membrane protein
MQRIVKYSRTLFQKYNEDNVTQLAASLAFFTVFSLAPLLLIVVVIAGLIIGQSEAQQQIVSQVQTVAGENVAEQVDQIITNMSERDNSLIASIVGGITLFIGATTLFAQLQQSLNRIWNVKPKPERSAVKVLIRKRVLSFIMILFIGLLLLASVIAGTFISNLSVFVQETVPGIEFISRVLNFVVSFVILTLVFAFIYKVLPDVKISWEDVWFGAAVTALLFTIGILLISLYINESTITSPYGAAGTFIVILLWVYFSAQLLFIGAQITQVYAETYGKEIHPDDNAVVIRKVEYETNEPASSPAS